MTIDDGEYYSAIPYVQLRRRRVRQPEKKEIRLDVDAFRQELLDNIKQNPTQIGDKHIVMCWPETESTRRVRLKKFLEKRFCVAPLFRRG
ncbi:MAG: hypothetical protein PHF86_04835 [Candidatus Nanoarchaeia archaeon]|jgi:hypothetical protein|nr:hypothetical protein [Candidatus Nanoarchaeia archaeon]